MIKRMTVKELRVALNMFDDDVQILLEGCDCSEFCIGLTVLVDKREGFGDPTPIVYLRRDNGVDNFSQEG